MKPKEIHIMVLPSKAFRVVSVLTLAVMLLCMGAVTTFASSVSQGRDQLRTAEPSLRSGIEKYYPEYFVLQPGDVRTIASILLDFGKRVSPDAFVRAYVRRADNRFYYTTDLEQLFKDPNVAPTHVSFVGLELVIPNPDRPSTQQFHSAAVRFPRGHSVQFVIDRDDPEWGLLLANELEPHIMATFRLNDLPRWPVSVVLILLSSVLFRLGVAAKEHSSGIRKEVSEAVVSIAAICTVVVLADLIAGPFFDFMLVGWIHQQLLPNDVFAWGGGLEQFENARSTRSLVLWGVGVAFVVGISVNVLTHFMLRQRASLSVLGSRPHDATSPVAEAVGSGADGHDEAVKRGRSEER